MKVILDENQPEVLDYETYYKSRLNKMYLCKCTPVPTKNESENQPITVQYICGYTSDKLEYINLPKIIKKIDNLTVKIPNININHTSYNATKRDKYI